MSKRVSKHLGVSIGAFLIACSATAIGAAILAEGSSGGDAATRDKIVRYVRARFGVPESTKLTVDPFEPSPSPEFQKTVIVSDDGKQKHPNQALVSKDRRLLVLGNLYPVSGNAQSEMIQKVREQFKIPSAADVSAGPPHSSPYPNLLATTFTVDDGKQKQTQDFYLTKDNRYFLLGSVFNLAVDPKREALRTLSTVNQPSQGPSNAPVTMVEFGDLQCPTCAHLHEFMENQLIPKYGDKLRVVYKEFPLPSIHDWTLVATIANQCAYQINPETYVPLRTLIFKNQQSMTAANVRDQVISFGEQVGLDRLRFAACIDSKASLPRVEENFREGQSLGVQSTPTSFINGKMIVGMPTQDLFSAVDEALRAAK